MTWVVEIFTTAGSTRFTIDANELEDGMASGTASGVAPLAESGLIAEVRPETTEPIKIPTISVSATNKAATAFSRRAQLTISFTGSPIALTPVFSVLPNPSDCRHLNYPCTQKVRVNGPYYNTGDFPELLSARGALEYTLSFRT